MNALAPDLAQARRFLDLLDPDAEAFTFQTFDDSELKRGHLARVYHGSLDEEAQRLAAVQNAGAGVFVTINGTDGMGRKAENIVGVRAVFVDLDGSPVQPVIACEIPPHIVIESSPGRFHAYWFVDGLALDQFASVQKAIAARFNGDPSVNDLPRVMRVPGFMHQKGEPFLSSIVHAHVGQPYSPAQILEAFPPIKTKPKGNGAAGDHESAETAELVRRILSGEQYHDAIRDLAWRFFRKGMPAGEVTKTLQGMLQAAVPEANRNDRWRARYAEIARTVETAVKKQRPEAAAGETFDQTVERLAQLPPHEYDRVRKAEADRLGVRVGTLDDACATLRNQRSKGRTRQSGQGNQGDSFDHDFDRPQVELLDRSKAIADAGNVLELVADAVEALGAAGVRREAKILYLAITTRLLSHPFRPAHVLVKGASAGGKNYLVDVVAQLMPESAIYKMTGMSDRALAYLTEPMAHRFIILAETAAIEDSEVALALVRSLLSEGEIRYPTVEKDENGKLAATVKHLEGPTGLIMTTTSPKIHAENETRHLSLNIRDDWCQTQAILQEQAKLSAGKDVDGVDLEPWHGFQQWLEGQECRAVIPFAAKVASLVNVGPVRIRRDFPRFLALIMAHAILHQKNRERDAAGRIVATLKDYAAVHELVARDFAETAELAHPATIVQVVEAVRELQVSRPDGVTIHVLIEHAKAEAWGSTDRDVLTRRCRAAIARGLLVNLETRRRQPARYRLSAGGCEDAGLFPSVSDLEPSTSFDFDQAQDLSGGRSHPIDGQQVFFDFDPSTSESEEAGARARIGSCAYCFDAAYSDDADHVASGGVLHYRCTTLWTRSQPK